MTETVVTETRSLDRALPNSHPYAGEATTPRRRRKLESSYDRESLKHVSPELSLTFGSGREFLEERWASKAAKVLSESKIARYEAKNEEYRELFGLPDNEMMVEDFNCALQKKILLQV